jgi:hypothetical protein
LAELRNNDGTRWDWDKGTKHLGPCFPRRISWGDLDGEIEINGHFLVVEGKRTHQSITGGQKYSMDARLRDGRVIYVVYGDPPTDIRAMQFWPDAQRVSATWETFWHACKEWAEWAESEPRPEERHAIFFPSFVAQTAAASTPTAA